MYYPNSASRRPRYGKAECQQHCGLLSYVGGPHNCLPGKQSNVGCEVNIRRSCVKILEVHPSMRHQWGGLVRPWCVSFPNVQLLGFGHDNIER